MRFKTKLKLNLNFFSKPSQETIQMDISNGGRRSMFSEAVRKYSRILLEPLARFISATGLSPNVVTVIGFLLMIGVAFVLAWGYLFLGGILITGVALFDGIDGTMARMMGRTSRFGAFLDSTL